MTGAGARGDGGREYEALVGRVVALIGEHTPASSRVLVVSRGDGRLVNVPGRDVGHFPQSSTGLYAGHYPADGGEAVAHLRRLQEAGAEYLVIPATGLWWLEHYAELGSWLQDEASVAGGDPETAMVYRLGRERPPLAEVESRDGRTAPQVEGLLAALLPADADIVVVGPGPPDDGDGGSVADVLARIDAAAAGGAGYLALTIPEDLREAPDGALRRALAGRYRRICAQRLVDLFELTAPSTDHG